MSLILASVAFTQYAIFSWPPYLYIDKIGRRWTVMLSAMGCCVCMCVIAGCLLSTSHTTAATAVAFMFLFMDCFTLGILPVSWSYSAEIQPLRVRNKSTAVGVFAHWTSNFVVVMVTPIGLNNIKGNYFWIWGAVNALFVPLTWFFGVETSGRTLEEIDELVSPFMRSIIYLSNAEDSSTSTHESSWVWTKLPPGLSNTLQPMPRNVSESSVLPTSERREECPSSPPTKFRASSRNFTLRSMQCRGAGICLQIRRLT